jgi:DNA-directed RNA polymerase specialized sigma24 family protein
MGVKSLADSVEICQDVWLRMLQRPLTAAFATPGDLLAYLETMAENRVRALHRAESSPRRDRRRHDPNPIEQLDVLVEEPQPIVRIMDRELAAEIRGKMGDVFRQVHELHCEGLEWTQIGEQMGFAPDVLRKRYQRLIARLQADRGIG